MRIQVKRDWKAALCSSVEVGRVAQAILACEGQLDRDKEHLWVFGLDGKNRIGYIDLVHLGALNQCIAHPREIFRLAVMKAAGAIIIVHNHPSGDPSPSSHDTALTERLVKAGDVLGIKVLDHVIVGEEGCCFSFADAGIL